MLGLYIPDPAVFPSTWPSEFMVGGINDPSVYIQCCGGICLVVLPGRCRV